MVRRLWAIADQACSSATNLALAVTAARTLEVDDFGFFAIIMAIYWITIGSCRALAGETLLVTQGGAGSRSDTHRAVPTVTFWIGLLFAVPVAALPLFLPHYSAALWALSAVLPVVALQDGLRYVCFARKRYSLAAASDLVWLSTIVFIAVVPSSGPGASLSGLILVWGIGGLASCWIVLPMAARPVTVSAARSWLADHRSLSTRSLGEFMIGSGVAQAVVFGLPLIGSLRASADFKVIQLAVAPWQVTVTAVSVLAIPYVSGRARSADRRAGLRACRWLSLAAGALGGLYAAAIAALPAGRLDGVLGDAWSGASHSAPIYAVAATFIAMSQCIVYLMRARGQSGRILLARTALAPVTLCLALGGAWLLDVRGLVLGLLLSAGITLVLWWTIAVRSVGGSDLDGEQAHRTTTGDRMPSRFFEDGQRILFVASTGGHLAQLYRLAQRNVAADDSLWVTFDSPQSRSLLVGKNVLFVPYIAPRDLRGTVKAAHQVAQEIDFSKYDLAVSTGAGLALAVLPQARLRHVPTLYIESVSRFDGPSLTGRIIAGLRLTALRTQHARWADRRWRPIEPVLQDFCSVTREVDRVSSIFVTLGTIRPYRFDSLIRGVLDTGLPDGGTTWQTGSTDGLDLPGTQLESMSSAEFEHAAKAADLVITHAGVGTILQLLEWGVNPVVVPRRKSRGEHVDDHQTQICDFLRAADIGTVLEVDDISCASLTAAARQATFLRTSTAEF